MYCIKEGGDAITLVDLLSNEKPIVQNMTIKSAKILDKINNPKLQETYMLSNTTAIGTPGAIIHVLKFYNMLAWENSYDLNLIYKDELKGNFRFRKFQPQTYNDLIEMGILIGDEVITVDTRVTTILVYDLDQSSKISNIRMIAKHDIVLGKKDKVILSNIYIDRFANIWAVLSNQTLNMYAMVPHPPRYETPESKLENLFLKKAFDFSGDPALDG